MKRFILYLLLFSSSLHALPPEVVRLQQDYDQLSVALFDTRILYKTILEDELKFCLSFEGRARYWRVINSLLGRIELLEEQVDETYIALCAAEVRYGLLPELVPEGS